MLKFYSSHCPKCRMLKSLMDKKGIEYELIDDDHTYLPIANEHKIMSMPFAELDNRILDTKSLQEYIMTI